MFFDSVFNFAQGRAERESLEETINDGHKSVGLLWTDAMRGRQRAGRLNDCPRDERERMTLLSIPRFCGGSRRSRSQECFCIPSGIGYGNGVAGDEERVLML